MRTLAASILLLNLLQFVFAVGFATSTGTSSIPIYPFTIPHLTVVALAVVLLGCRVYTDTKNLLITSGIAVVLAASLLTAGYGLSRWPGGNDGPGLGWALFVGPLSVVNAAAAIAFLVSAVLHSRRPRADG